MLLVTLWILSLWKVLQYLDSYLEMEFSAVGAVGAGAWFSLARMAPETPHAGAF